MAEDKAPEVRELFGIGDPDSGAALATEPPIAPPLNQPLTRREAREAADRAAVRHTPVKKSVPQARAASKPRVTKPARMPKRVVTVKAVGARTPAKKKQNPFSVFFTMFAVSGMIAVAALPAYAMIPGTASVADTAPSSNREDLTAQSIIVNGSVASAAPSRDAFSATTPAELAQAKRDAMRAALSTQYQFSGARELGDDYPWPYELSDNQGGGLSPLNYFYRECVDFVAWRLNRDAGSYSQPFKYVWSNLTPGGGSAYAWKRAWEGHGWPMSDVPVVGAVAWFAGQNHVAYVRSINGDGTVSIEEYNWGNDHAYNQRTISTSSVSMFLYPPPR